MQRADAGNPLAPDVRHTRSFAVHEQTQVRAVVGKRHVPPFTERQRAGIAPDGEDIFRSATDVQIRARPPAIEHQSIVTFRPFVRVLVHDPAPGVTVLRLFFEAHPGFDRERLRFQLSRVRRLDVVRAITAQTGPDLP